MATTNTPAETPTNYADVGVFINTVDVGYVPATPEEIRRMDAAMREMPQTSTSNRFLSDLLLIKLLAPMESRELLIYPAPMVVRFVSQLRTDLTMRYYGER